MRRQSDLSGECITLSNMAVVATKQGNFAEAWEPLQKALILAPKTGNATDLQLVNAALGHYYTAQKNDSSAVFYFQKVINSSEKIRSGLGLESYKRTYAQSSKEVYAQMILALLRMGRTEEAFNYAEQSRARAFWISSAQNPVGNSGKGIK